ncbi:MAG: hypothetical protein IJ176_08500 [Prevotella sp.]|nr:hypothetical protein [Prevotella sp.]
MQNISGFTSLVSKEEGDVFGLIYSRSFCEADSRDESYSNIIFMNPISDRYRFVDARLVIDDEANTWYVVKSENKSMAEQTLSNTPDLFVELEQQFEDTPGGNFDKGNHSFLMLRAAVKNKEVPIAYTMPKFSSARGSMKAFIDAPKNTDDSSAHIDIYTYMCYADHERADTTVFEWYDENGQLQRFEAINYIVQRTESNPIVQTGSSLRSICSGRALYDPRNIGLPITEYPAFSFGLDQQRQPLGSGCPVNVVQVYNGLIGNVSRLESYFIGRHGEWRMVDNLRSKVNMKYDGETVGEGTMNSVGYEVPGEHEGGLFEVTITDSNVLVDGLAGQNVTTMAYRHGLDDWTPPVLQMLQFRSIDDNVTDRFSQPADGLLTFAGGDFYVSANESYPVFDVNAQVAEVWYAPYGTVNWTTLEVEEVPENFFMPGFGYFYRGALANVQGSAENGWFDLKIRLTDAVGNWQEQIISPAFRIDELVATGIEDVRCESADSGKHFYSIDGKQLSHPQPGLNVVKASDGSVRKIIW